MNSRRSLHPVVAVVLAFALILSPLTPVLQAQEGTNVWLPLIGNGVRDSATLNEPNAKLDWAVADLVALANLPAEQRTLLMKTTATQDIAIDGELIQVELEFDRPHVDELTAEIEAIGGRVAIVSEFYPVMQVWLPVSEIKSLIQREHVYFIRRLSRPTIEPLDGTQLSRQAQSISKTTEALEAMGVTAWHNARYKGKGVRIGIIDSSHTSLSRIGKKRDRKRVIET